VVISVRMRRADSRKFWPSPVRSTCRVLRSNRRRPRSSSSARMRALNAGCDRWHWAAARVKLRCSARARKASSWRVERWWLLIVGGLI